MNVWWYDIPLSKTNVSQYDTFYERIAKWRIPKLSHSLSRFNMSLRWRRHHCQYSGPLWTLIRALSRERSLSCHTCCYMDLSFYCLIRRYTFCNNRGKEGLFWPNLTKAGPLFTLSHRGSDTCNSPLLTWTLNELCIFILRHMVSTNQITFLEWSAVFGVLLLTKI